MVQGSIIPNKTRATAMIQLAMKKRSCNPKLAELKLFELYCQSLQLLPKFVSTPVQVTITVIFVWLCTHACTSAHTHTHTYTHTHISCKKVKYVHTNYTSIL